MYFYLSLFLGQDFEKVTEHHVNKKEFSTLNKRKIATAFISRFLRKPPTLTQISPTSITSDNVESGKMILLLIKVVYLCCTMKNYNRTMMLI